MSLIETQTLRWTKRGHLFGPPASDTWMQSHAQVPTVLVLSDRIRVYFATRPHKKLSLTTFVDLDINDFSNVLYVHPEPILQPGRPGMFDEHGVMPASVVMNDGIVYLYYSGWQQGVSIPYNNYTGLAISEDEGKTFSKYAEGPIIDRTPYELFSATSPDVLFENGNWHMWYSSGTHWLEVDGKLEHTYELKSATSRNGKIWDQTNETVIAQSSEQEAITRPTVIRLEDGYHMWYCYRGTQDFRHGQDSYRIGYATSYDLVNWRREDALAGIDVSGDGWDSQMIAYPCVFQVNDRVFMFYNGNDFGEAGFGYAILETQEIA